MNRGIDHLVLCVDDLEAARDFYTALGFHLTPTALHPFGTANALVQLQGSFLELLTVNDPSFIQPPADGEFSFAHHNQSYLEDGEGMSMLVFESMDARADQAEFKLKGLDTYAPFAFSRTARLPDGAEVTVGFSLAFVTHADMPRSAFFCCQQHAPQHFWKPEYQVHDNGAQAVHAVILVAREPRRYGDFFRALQGTEAVTEAPNGLQVATARGDLHVMSPEAYGQTYGEDTVPDLTRGPRFAAMVVAVSDLAGAARICEQNGIAANAAPGTIRIFPDKAFGTLVEFCQG